LKLSRSQLAVVLYLFAGIWIVSLILEGVRPSLNLVRPISIASTAALLLVAAFERYVWRLQILHPWLVQWPVLRGTWRGELESEWVDPATGKTRPASTVYLAVRQTMSAVSVRLLTDESTSRSLAADISAGADGVHNLTVVYVNEPPAGRRATSPIHKGGMDLEIQGSGPSSLVGDYWTDRLSRGHLTFELRSRKIHDSYRSAERDSTLNE
jgi:SMODS-associating 2TM, beta-strand rich effector domain